MVKSEMIFSDLWIVGLLEYVLRGNSLWLEVVNAGRHRNTGDRTTVEGWGWVVEVGWGT